ncbi:cytochrome P450 [Streptomyces sp. HB132]|uniref:cytochrome P450 n=1 Tax=Streptomyces sp. HB132 TaxID=767388 RepID=UPI001960475F|nr:cytochrome P450 [Streptomyces sp. HB132]MBM7438720.1 cytochrome P450 [Streptomyces sp. HB132]
MTPHTPASHVPLWDEAFAADPHGAYRQMRARYGPLVPVELAPGVPATLVIGYAQAVRILHDEPRFPADPRQWQTSVPDTCPVKPMLEWRPNAIRSSGREHARYREANRAALHGADQHRLRGLVEQVCEEAIGGFQGHGQADLLNQFAWKVAFDVLSELLGCPDGIGNRIANGIIELFDGVNAIRGNEILGQAVADLVTLKRLRPGNDVTSHLLAHPAQLTDTEMSHQVVTLYGAGIEPVVNLITNTLLQLLTDPVVSGDVHAGGASVREALDLVLYRDPPMANYCASYPPHPVEIDGYLLPAHQPVVISMAGCNNDPAVGAPSSGSRAHLAWGAGPHACPARPIAHLIAETAITHLLDALPTMVLARPAQDLTWRPGPFHRALTHLPVTFPAVTSH